MTSLFGFFASILILVVFGCSSEQQGALVDGDAGPIPDGDTESTKWEPDPTRPCMESTQCEIGERCVQSTDGSFCSWYKPGKTCTDLKEECAEAGSDCWCHNGFCLCPDPGLADGDKETEIEFDDDVDMSESDGDREFDYPEQDIDLQSCDYNPYLNEARIQVTPGKLDFGSVMQGSSTPLNLVVCNAGGIPLWVTGMQLATTSSPEFHLQHVAMPAILPPGQSVKVKVTYIPINAEEDKGEVLIYSNDSANATMRIPITSSIKNAPFVEISPRTIQFLSEPGQVTSRVARVVNNGLAATQVSSIQVMNSASSFSVKEVVKEGAGQNPLMAPWDLLSGEALIVTIQLATPDIGEVADETLQAVWSSDSGSEESRATLTTHIASICAVPIAEPDQTVRPLDTVTLDGSQSYDPNGSVQAYRWVWQEKPAEAEGAIIKDSNGTPIEGQWTTESHPNFFAQLAGTYILRLTLKDEDQDCSEVNYDTVTIQVVPDETIHIQLMWSRTDNDHDLHLIRPGGHHTRNCKESGNNTECCWSNCDTINGSKKPCPARGCPGPDIAPDWGNTDVREDDPTLDIDDIDGRGPENINLSLPEVGDYLVTVENFKSLDPVTVTVKIFLFGVLKATIRYGVPFTKESIPLNSHWNVCWLKVKGGTDITIEPIGTVEASH